MSIMQPVAVCNLFEKDAVMEQAEISGNETPAIKAVRTVFRAYADRNRAAIDEVLAEDFHFSSPRDNRIDRETFFARCWPHSENIVDFKFVYLADDGEQVFATLEARNTKGYRFRNTEIWSFRHGKLVEAEVYFGWTLPHEAPLGGFTDRPEGQWS
jgi:ketosteroid isomerase-like protein